MNRFTSAFFVLGLALLHTSCGSSSDDEGGGDSETASAVTTLEGSLISDTILELVHRNSGGLLAASTGLNEAMTPCPSGSDTCFTPSAFGGLYDSFSVRVSNDGAYTNLTIIPSTTAGVADKSFDFGSPSAVSGSYECCDGESWGNNDGVQLKDMIWTLGAIDFTFDGESLGFTGTHTLKLVYADNEALGYERGDVLLKVGDDYTWCPTTALTTADCSTTRMDSAITQEAAFVDYEAAAGDPQLPYFDAELYADASGSIQSPPASEDLIASTFAFTVDFDMEDSMAVPEPDAVYADIFEAMPEIYARGLNVAPTGTLQSVGMNAVVTVVAQED
ncbi:MAG: hypothetical protein Q7T11_00920 [Deltaproteobacteria bacterium]|nr:hypothetical protein [Deltaproteobacteria bacterium]